MYNFIIKEGGPELDIIITRAMLSLAAIAALLYRTGEYYFLSIISSAVLFVAAVFIKSLITKSKISTILLLSGAAVVLFIATGSISFALILLAYGYLVKLFYKKSSIEVSNKGVAIRKFFGTLLHPWSEFSNIILKDNLLTLDFRNNKLMQLNIDDTAANIDEAAFNKFCEEFI